MSGRNAAQQPWRFIFLGLLTGYGLLVMYWMLFGFNRQVLPEAPFNFVPFATIQMFVRLYGTHPIASATNLIGNVVLFIPFGVLIPLVFGGKWGRMLLIFVGCVVAMELAQYFLRRGSLDVDDLMLNVVGALIGRSTLQFAIWAQHKFSGKSIQSQL